MVISIENCGVLVHTKSNMTNEKENESEEIKSKESEANKRKKRVPVEVHKARSENSYVISESSDESMRS